MNSKTTLKTLFGNLENDIKEFRKSINEKYETDLKERTSFKMEVSRIAADGMRVVTETGIKIQTSADSLTQALRGDFKAQGKWGEFILKKTLERSGLQEGEHYTVETSYENAEGNRQRPDITVLLPDQKSLFIDSKVSLAHYIQYIDASDELIKASALENLISAFCNHIKILSGKEYQDVSGVDTVDFVLMFIPVESIFSLVTDNYDKSNTETLFEFAWKKGVVISSPTTLMPILKTINRCWNIDNYNKNAQNIGKKAGELYKKFTTLMVSFEKVGRNIEKSQEAFIETKKLIQCGNGNILKRCDEIRGLLNKKRSGPLEHYYDETDDFDEDDNSESQLAQVGVSNDLPF